MREVTRPVMRPMHCAAIPHIGHTAEGQRWVDTRSEMPGFDNHVYLSETAIRTAAGALGLEFVDPAEAAAYTEAIQGAEAELADARREIERLRELLAASDLLKAYRLTAEPEPAPLKPKTKVKA